VDVLSGLRASPRLMTMRDTAAGVGKDRGTPPKKKMGRRTRE
jgi:hypothetical protein